MESDEVKTPEDAERITAALNGAIGWIAGTTNEGNNAASQETRRALRIHATQTRHIARLCALPRELKAGVDWDGCASDLHQAADYMAGLEGALRELLASPDPSIATLERCRAALGVQLTDGPSTHQRPEAGARQVMRYGDPTPDDSHREREWEHAEALARIEAHDEAEGEFDYADDVCPTCGCTALESFDCALNGCRFGLLAENHGPASAPDKQGSREVNP